MVGNRIAVYGPGGSGKTTVSRRIGASLGLPVVEFDALFHKPNWEPTPEAEFREKILRTLAGHTGGWVTDGNYGIVRREVMALADTIVWLKLPFRVVYWRLLRRTVTRSWRKEELWNTNRESFRLSFMSKDSILLWGITHWRTHQRNVGRDIREASDHARVIVLRSEREVTAFLRSLEREATRVDVNKSQSAG